MVNFFRANSYLAEAKRAVSLTKQTNKQTNPQKTSLALQQSLGEPNTSQLDPWSVGDVHVWRARGERSLLSTFSGMCCTGGQHSCCRAAGSAFENKLQPAGTKPLKEGIGYLLVCRNKFVPKKKGKIPGNVFKPNIQDVLVSPHYCGYLKAFWLWPFFDVRNNYFGRIFTLLVILNCWRMLQKERLWKSW